MKNINIIDDGKNSLKNPFITDSNFFPFVGKEVAEYFFACYGKDYSTNLMLEEYLNNTTEEANTILFNNTFVMEVNK